MTKFVCVTAIEFNKPEFPLKTAINIEEISFFRALYRTSIHGMKTPVSSHIRL